MSVRSAAAPFIVNGYARFWDSWGEVRHAEKGLRPHLGQDVFCDYDARVLASESGRLEYGVDATGGLVARVFTADNAYWYYAHLSRYGSLDSGSHVEPGDVIGHCGTSGNAAGTPPHIHFSRFVDHVAQNPIDALIGWLGRAEARSARLLKKAERVERRTSRTELIALKQPLLESPMSAGGYCYPEPLEESLGLAMLAPAAT